MKEISRIEAVKLIQGQAKNEEVFTAVFIKKDGSERSMNCKFGVTEGVKGVGMKYDPHSHGMLPVYDVKAEGFRMLNIGTLKQLTIGENNYSIIEEK